MHIHYFQRYHQKENVATANTMLLLSRLYQDSPSKFFSMLSALVALDDFDPGIVFTIQEKDEGSVPDATIAQEGFKVAVETKLGAWFDEDQLLKHCTALDGFKTRVLLTLAPVPMDAQQRAHVDTRIHERYGAAIVHVNTTFAGIIDAVQEVLDDHDSVMLDVLEDFREYCEHDELVGKAGTESLMRMQLATKTLDFGLEHGLYFCDSGTSMRPFTYLGLYARKSVRAVGRVQCIARRDPSSGGEVVVESGRPPGDWLDQIAAADTFAEESGWEPLSNTRFFFVDRFWETDFRKTSLYAPRGSRVFDLFDVLGTDALPTTEEIACQLRTRTWK